MSDTAAMTKQPPLTEDDIIAWLEKHPRFLQENPDILDALLPPKEKKGKGVADFQYYMVQRLKADRDEVLESAREIVETSRANMNNLARVHGAVLTLLDATNFEDFIRALTLDCASLLDVDIITLLVETDSRNIPQIELPGVRAVSEGTVDLLMKDKVIILESGINGLSEIYGGGAGLVKSQALVRLAITPGAPSALLAFGSRDPGLFAAGQATDLLGFLSRVIERCFRSWLDLS